MFLRGRGQSEIGTQRDEDKEATGEAPRRLASCQAGSERRQKEQHVLPTPRDFVNRDCCRTTLMQF